MTKLCAHQVPRNSLQTAISGGGGVQGAHGLGYTGSWVLEYLCCHQTIIQTHPWGNRKVSENIKF